MDYLQKKDTQNESPYDKISDLLLKLFMERPPQCRVYSEFEELVSQLSLGEQQTCREPTEEEKIRAGFAFQQFKKPIVFNPEAEEEEKEAEPENDEEAEEGEPEEGVEAEDLPQLSRVLLNSGIPFSQIDAFKLQTAIYDLAKREERTSDKIKLFGKVGPYWLLRSETETYPEPEEEEKEAEEEEEAEKGEENAEDQSEKDEELIGLRDQWKEIEAEIEAEAAADKPEGAEGDQEGELNEDGEKIEGEEQKQENEEEDDEKEPAEGEAPAEPEQADEEEPEEEKDEIKSEVSLEDEFQPETKIPKKIPVFGGEVYPKKKIQKLPIEEHEGINKELFFAAIDDNISPYMTQLYVKLQKELELQKYRHEKKLKQQKSKLNKIIQKLLSEPLRFIALPEITPEQMRVFMQMPAQTVRFTGDLTADVISSIPPFPYSESVLLRCACARILHENCIVPKGLYTKEEDEEDEEIKPKIEDLEQLEQQRVQKRYALMAKFQNSRIYEIMLKHPDLWTYNEDEDKLELEANFPELNEEFKGYESPELLLNPKNWSYLLPRITGQGRAAPVNDDDYDNIDDPEPVEFLIAKLQKQRRKDAREQKKQIRMKLRETEIEEKKQIMKKKKFAQWLEQQQEVWTQQEDEIVGNEASDDEINVQVDDFDDSAKPDKFDIDSSPNYEEISKYYAVRLWRKLREFKRPVDPWDVPILDNRINAALPELFIEEGQLDRTRVDFKQKCKYHVDEGYNANILNIEVNGSVKSKIPLWRFNQIDLQGIGKGPKAIIATNARWPGAANVVTGARMQRCQFVYFGDGLGSQQLEMQDFQIPEMCMPPFDIMEECEVDPVHQREEWEVIQDKIKRIEAAKKAAEEAAAAEEQQEPEAE
ncbi:Radial spokehead-like protein [Spironucleus salmonicida]|uniref:Radial spokehead-like protein n=1 Tax=Spironucleus salmonicida TaxID=348837 RepID=V6LH27_9EUKA|nr:Radial spokehead-like protein [Spironucleus salmonicida]|eukprot:EST43613.1 Radial spokehead-like protein [Spironucleus salmonicida]